jgi:hypothetical protein
MGDLRFTRPTIHVRHPCSCSGYRGTIAQCFDQSTSCNNSSFLRRLSFCCPPSCHVPAQHCAWPRVAVRECRLSAIWTTWRQWHVLRSTRTCGPSTSTTAGKSGLRSQRSSVSECQQFADRADVRSLPAWQGPVLIVGAYVDVSIVAIAMRCLGDQ